MTSEVSGEGALSQPRLQYLKQTIERDIARGLYHGASYVVGRHGQIGAQVAVGQHRSDDPRALATDSVFNLLSVSKAFTNVLVLRAIELGQLSLQTRVASVIPEFKGGQRDRITLYHLMTHTSGLPSVFTPVPGMCIDRLDEVIAKICERVHSIEEPGRHVNYSPMASHALMGEMVRRTDPQGRSFRQIAQEELFGPAGMKDTAFGLRRDLKPRHVKLQLPEPFPATHPGHSNLGPHGAFEEEDAEMPFVGGVATAYDLYRFAEMLRRGGEIDGARILGRATVDMATRVQTGEMPNELYRSLALSRGWEPYPAYMGLGFSMRGDKLCHHQFGNLSSPRTFGNHGAGSTLFWVDPKLDMSFACLTSGVMDEGDNVERFQRLSDIALSAAT